MIPYGRQDISQEDIDAVVEVLKSDFLTQGPKVPAFERALCDYASAKFSCAVNSATSALHLACRALDVGPNDLVWTSPITFVATANCARYCGADVDFVDIDSRTYNMCPSRLEEKLAKAKLQRRLPKVVIPVHLCGSPCDMQAIRALGDRYRFSIIEDASHAIGGMYGERKIGSSEYSDITVFSFHPVKIITTAEGGAALTNRQDLVRKMELLRSHGITRDPKQMLGKEHGDWFYEQIDLGFNYKMTELQAALGLAQIRRIDEFVARRHELADRYDMMLDGLPVRTPSRGSLGLSAMHLYAIQLDETLGRKRKQIFRDMRADGVGVSVHYIPVHMQPYYKSLGFHEGDFPVSEAYYRHAISIPLYYALTFEDQDKVVKALTNALTKCRRGPRLDR